MALVEFKLPFETIIKCNICGYEPRGISDENSEYCETGDCDDSCNLNSGQEVQIYFYKTLGSLDLEKKTLRIRRISYAQPGETILSVVTLGFEEIPAHYIVLTLEELDGSIFGEMSLYHFWLWQEGSIEKLVTAGLIRNKLSGKSFGNPITCYSEPKK